MQEKQKTRNQGNEKGDINILIADDHGVVREGIIKSLSAGLKGVEFEEAENASEVMKKLAEKSCNLAILDINMPGRNGMEVVKEILEHHPKTKVIIFSMYPEDQFGVRAIKAGASAYLTKDIPAKKLVDAIKQILNGERYLTPSMADLIANEIADNRKKSTHEILSDREYQVFLLISNGNSISDIAEKLNLSVKTISVYRGNILKKMNLKNNAEILHYAFKNRLIF